MGKSIEISLRGGFIISLAKESGAIKAIVRVENSSKQWVGLLEGLKMSSISWMSKMPSLISRKIFINKSTLELKVCPGLLGSSSVPRNDNRIQENAQYLSVLIKSKMEDNELDAESIDNLSNVEIFDCTNLLQIFSNLSQNIDKSPLWQGEYKVDDEKQLKNNKEKFFNDNEEKDSWLGEYMVDDETRFNNNKQKLLKIMRVVLMIHIFRSERDAIFTSEQQNELIKKINTAIDLVQTKNQIHLSLLLELKIMKKLILDAKNTNSTWTKIGNAINFSFKIIGSVKNYKIGSLFTELVSAIKKIKEKLETRYIDYVLKLTIFEILDRRTGFTIGEIEIFLIREFDSVKTLKWQKIYFLLDYTREFTASKGFSDRFILEFIIPKIQDLLHHKNWRVKEKAVRFIFFLIEDQSGEVKSKANEILQKYYEQLSTGKIKKDDERIKEIITNKIEKIKRPMTNRESESKCFRDFDKIHYKTIIRAQEHKEIHNILRRKKLLVIHQMNRMGKSCLALQYCKKYKHTYKVILQINSKSYRQDFQKLSHFFNIKIDDKLEIVENEIIEKLKTSKVQILLYFDNLENFQILEKYFFEFNNDYVKYLVTSKQEFSSKSFSRIRISEDSFENLKLKGIPNDKVESFLIEVDSSIKMHSRKLAKKIDGIGGRITVIMQNIKSKVDINEILSINFEAQDDLDKIKEFQLKLKDNLLNEVFYCLEIFSLCSAKDIPEYMVKEITEEKFPDSWERVVPKLLELHIINLEMIKKMFNIDENTHKKLANIGDFQKNRKTLLEYFSKEFDVCEKIHEDTGKLEKMRDLIQHAENISANREIEDINELYLSINLASSYIKIIYDKEKFDRELNKIENYLKIVGDIDLDISWNNKIGNLYLMINSPRAQYYFTKNIDLNPSSNSLDMAITYSNYAKTVENQKNYQKAINLYKKSLEILENNSSSNEKNLIETYKKISNLYISKNNFKKATDYLKQSLDNKRDIYYNYITEKALTYKDLGILLSEQPENLEAEEYFQKSIEILKKEALQSQDQKKELLSTYLEFAKFYEKNMKYKESELLYNLILKDQQADSLDYYKDLPGTLSCLAFIYFHMEKFDEAEEKFLECLKEQKKIFNNSYNKEILNTYNNLALNCMISCKKFENDPEEMSKKLKKAEEYCNECIFEDGKNNTESISDNIEIEYNPNYATTLSNLASLFEQMEKFNEAENLYKKSLNFFEKTYYGTHPFQSIILNNLGNLYSKQKKYTDAKKFYQESIKILIEVSKNDYRSLVTIYNNLAIMYLKKNKNRNVEENYKKGLKILKDNAKHIDRNLSIEFLKNIKEFSTQFKVGDEMIELFNEVSSISGNENFIDRNQEMSGMDTKNAVSINEVVLIDRE